MEMARPWKSAKRADSHRRLEKSRQTAARLSHISTGPCWDLPLWGAVEKPTTGAEEQKSKQGARMRQRILASILYWIASRKVTSAGQKVRMQLKTILNRVQKFKSFVYGRIVWLDAGGNLALLVEIVARANSKPICSGCGHPAPGYDTLPPRMFEFVPLWNIPVFFAYAPRRVDCPSCGVKVERAPWADGKHTLTKTYMQFLATWAKRLSWKETAVAFRTTWEKVFRSVEWAVQWGLHHRDLSNVPSIGADKVLWEQGHKYVTVVYQIDIECKRLLWIGKDRTIRTGCRRRITLRLCRLPICFHGTARRLPSVHSAWRHGG